MLRTFPEGHTVALLYNGTQKQACMYCPFSMMVHTEIMQYHASCNVVTIFNKKMFMITNVVV